MAEDKQLTVAELLARSSKERERRGSAVPLNKELTARKLLAVDVAAA